MRSALLAVATMLAAAGCGGKLEPPAAPSRPPTEAQTRDAYFDTPVIVDDAGRSAPLGITRSRLAQLLGGRAAIEYARGARLCVVYPIAGTEVWDAHGSPVAAEWEFCFGRDRRLEAKRRLPPGR